MNSVIEMDQRRAELASAGTILFARTYSRDFLAAPIDENGPYAWAIEKRLGNLQLQFTYSPGQSANLSQDSEDRSNPELPASQLSVSIPSKRHITHLKQAREVPFAQLTPREKRLPVSHARTALHLAGVIVGNELELRRADTLRLEWWSYAIQNTFARVENRQILSDIRQAGRSESDELSLLQYAATMVSCCLSYSESESFGMLKHVSAWPDVPSGNGESGGVISHRWLLEYDPSIEYSGREPVELLLKAEQTASDTMKACMRNRDYKRAQSGQYAEKDADEMHESVIRYQDSLDNIRDALRIAYQRESWRR